MADAYACLVVPLTDPPFMQVGEIEASCAVLHGDIEDLALFDWVGADAVPGQLAGLLVARGFSRSRIGVQAGRIEMGNRGPLDAKLLDSLRAKLEGMREPAKITTAGMRAAIDAAEPGKTENDIAALAASVMIARGSEFFSIDPIVNAGHRTGYFHTTFKRHPISAGDPVQLEFGGCFHR